MDRKALLLYRLIQIICSIHNSFLIHRITVYMLLMHSDYIRVSSKKLGKQTVRRHIRIDLTIQSEGTQMLSH